ncbi:hypothetical protein, partial [Salmonella enterica]|uniref:hypothetical protein n=1 Tax=Salmonella enterica TaxID=28901 RepID=UPI00265C86EF
SQTESGVLWVSLTWLLMVPESSFSNADTNKLHTDAPMACPTRQNTGKNFRHFGAFPNGLSPHLRMRKIT